MKTPLVLASLFLTSVAFADSASDTAQLRGIMGTITEMTQGGWFEAHTDAEIQKAPDTVRALADEADVLLARLGKPALPAESVSTLVTATQAALGTEKTCRSTPKCMAERKFFAEVVSPMCQADKVREIAQGDLDRERANPSGVVDLAYVHQAGEDVRANTVVIESLKPTYVKTRHHAWHGWKTECN